MKGNNFKDEYWNDKLQIYWAGYNGCEYIAYKGSHQVFEYPTWEYPSPPSRIVQHNKRIESEDDFKDALDSGEWYTANYHKVPEQHFDLDFSGDIKPVIFKDELGVNEEKWKIIEEAMEKAGEVFGVDPAYFGKEGNEEVDRQLRKMGYNPEDFKDGTK